jgi:hypothetical protein
MDTQRPAQESESPANFPDSYLLLLNGLSADKKLLLAERLIEPKPSISTTQEEEFIPEKTAEELIAELRSARSFTREREDF